MVRTFGYICWIASLAAVAHGFSFDWPNVAGQCETGRLTWTGGVPPYKIVLGALNDIVYTYNVDESAYDIETGQWSYDLQVQRVANTSYVIFMNDASGVGTGGSTPLIDVDHVSDVQCFIGSPANMTVIGPMLTVRPYQVAQCQSGFQMTWDNGNPPFNMTVISLNQTFDPYDVILGNGNSWDWTPNLPTGSEFMVMMNDQLGYGRGGTLGPYTVAASADESCLTGGTVTPGLYHTQTSIAAYTSTAAAADSTSTAAPNGNATDSSGYQSGPPPHGLSSGAIGGIAAGCTVVGLALIALAIWFVRKTRRSSRDGFGDRGKRGDGGVDIIPFTDKDDGGFGDEPYSAASAEGRTLPTLDRRQGARSGPGHRSDSKRRQAMRSSVVTHLESDTPMEGEHSRIDPFLGGLYSRTNRRYLEADAEEDTESQTSVFATAAEDDGGRENGVAEDALRNNDSSDDGISVVPHAATSESGWTAIDSQPISKSTVIASAMGHSSPESPISTNAPTVTNEKRRAPPPPIRTLLDPATRNTSHTGRTMFVRHQDAGMLGSGVDEVIDLPPLYTDVAHGVHASEDRAD